MAVHMFFITNLGYKIAIHCTQNVENKAALGTGNGNGIVAI